MSRAKKKKLVAKVAAHVDGEIETMRKAALDAAEGATHAEAKPENDKDTRALEASYLAAGQAARFRELMAARKQLDGLELLELKKSAPICASAVVTVEDEDEKASTWFMLPWFGGVTVELDGKKVQVVTPPSPLGAALLGKTVGDAIEVPGKGGKRELTITEVW